MSASRNGNGNGRIAKYNREVAEKAGLEKGEILSYAPDFLDSLVRRMAIPVPGESAERCLAWLIYRANGNQSRKPIHLYAKKGEVPAETELYQRDCALELAWVEAGHRVEWLDAPREIFQEEARRRGVKPIDKSVVSRGFHFNRLRGNIESGTGNSLVYVPAPDPKKFSTIRELCRRKGESPQAKPELFAWAKFSYARELREYEVARATEQRLLRFLTAEYKKSKGSQACETNGHTSLEALESLEPNPPSSSAFPTTQPNKAEEEDDRGSYQKFKEAYPRERFDEPKAKPSFERKTKAEQTRILDRLQIYLDCDRWRDDGGSWIPFASKWLESWEAEPPPALKKAKAAGADETERVRRIAAQVEEDRKWR